MYAGVLGGVLERGEMSETKIGVTTPFPPCVFSAAVSGLDVRIGDKHIVGHVKEKKAARKTYEKAISAGHGAYLLEVGSGSQVGETSGTSSGVLHLPPTPCVCSKMMRVMISSKQVSGTSLQVQRCVGCKV